MPRQSQHLPDDLREPHDIEWRGFSGFYLKAIGITILVGLVSGLMWIAWSLFRVHVLP